MKSLPQLMDTLQEGLLSGDSQTILHLLHNDAQWIDDFSLQIIRGRQSCLLQLDKHWPGFEHVLALETSMTPIGKQHALIIQRLQVRQNQQEQKLLLSASAHLAPDHWLLTHVHAHRLML